MIDHPKRKLVCISEHKNHTLHASICMGAKRHSVAHFTLVSISSSSDDLQVQPDAPMYLRCSGSFAAKGRHSHDTSAAAKSSVNTQVPYCTYTNHR